jgi:flavin-dependent dehydrogenase
VICARCLLLAAVIVGAGPAGGVCGHFLAQGGGKVALLDKEHFPRDKYVEPARNSAH